MYDSRSGRFGCGATCCRKVCMESIVFLFLDRHQRRYRNRKFFDISLSQVLSLLFWSLLRSFQVVIKDTCTPHMRLFRYNGLRTPCSCLTCIMRVMWPVKMHYSTLAVAGKCRPIGSKPRMSRTFSAWPPMREQRHDYTFWQWQVLSCLDNPCGNHTLMWFGFHVQRDS